jgi:hypothetical protein
LSTKKQLATFPFPHFFTENSLERKSVKSVRCGEKFTEKCFEQKSVKMNGKPMSARWERKEITEKCLERKSVKTDNWLSFNQKNSWPLFIFDTFLPKTALS